MADTTFKPFDDAKPEILDRLQTGFALDDEKLGDLKQAYEDVKGDISKLDLTLYSKAPTDTPAPEQGQSPSVVNDDATPAPTPEDPKWKEGVLKEWQQWANDNNKLLSPYQDTDNKDNLSFKLYADENAKNSDNFEADFSYASPKNVTLKGKDGQVPDEKYFDKLVTQLKAANGPEIEFGNIKSDEFKAKLLAACLKDPEIIITNAPSEPEIAGWNKNLKDIVSKAKEPKAEQPQPTKVSAYDTAKNSIRETLKTGKEIDIEKLKPKEKALYIAAAMDIVSEMNKDKKEGDKDFFPRDEVIFKGGMSYEETNKAAEKLPKEELDAAKAGLKSYTIMSMKKIAKERVEKRFKGHDSVFKKEANGSFKKDASGNLEIGGSWKNVDDQGQGMTADQLQLRELRMGVRKGDAKAKEEMDKRRAATMTDDFKYEREVEMEADGKTPKNDAKGKPIYKQVTEMEADGKTPKKDKDGNPVYKKDEKGNPVYVHKTDDKGNKIESPAYQSFKQRLDGYNKGK